jgi:hypothetical protein
LGFVDKIFRKRNENSGAKVEEVTTTNKPEDLVQLYSIILARNADEDVRMEYNLYRLPI